MVVLDLWRSTGNLNHPNPLQIFHISQTMKNWTESDVSQKLCTNSCFLPKASKSFHLVVFFLPSGNENDHQCTRQVISEKDSWLHTQFHSSQLSVESPQITKLDIILTFTTEWPWHKTKVNIDFKNNKTERPPIKHCSAYFQGLIWVSNTAILFQVIQK